MPAKRVEIAHARRPPRMATAAYEDRDVEEKAPERRHGRLRFAIPVFHVFFITGSAGNLRSSERRAGRRLLEKPREEVCAQSSPHAEVAG